jgi:hypothetical protein
MDALGKAGRMREARLLGCERQIRADGRGKGRQMLEAKQG